LTGELTFDGTPDSVFLIRTDGALNIAAAGNIIFTNGASADNVYWHVTGATTIGAGAVFAGTALTKGAITIGAGSKVRGRLLSIDGAITLDSSKIYSYDAPVIPLSPSTIDLRTADSYAILAGGAISNTGETNVIGDIGANPSGTFTGQESLTQDGELHLADDQAVQAKADLQSAYDSASSAFITADPISGDLIGLTLTAGAYRSPGALSLTGNLIFDAKGDSDAVFLIQSGGAVNVAAGATMAVINGGNIGNVYWQVTGAANVAAGAVFAGTVLAKDAINVADGATVTGRLLALGGAVALSSNSVTRVASSLELDAIAAAAQDALDAKAAEAAEAAKAAEAAEAAAIAAQEAADALAAEAAAIAAQEAADALAAEAAAEAADAQEAADALAAAQEAADVLAAEAAALASAQEAADAMAAAQEAAARAAAEQEAADALVAEAAAQAAAAREAADAVAAAQEAAARAAAEQEAADAVVAEAAAQAAAQEAAARAAAEQEAADALVAEAAAQAAAQEAAAQAAQATEVLRKALAAEAEEVRVYGPKVVMTFAPTPSLLVTQVIPLRENVVLQIAVVPAGPIAGGDASLAAQY
jgi:cytoskeletal protein CcmA (bactofilin family)